MMTPRKALMTATTEPARHLGISDDVGSIAVGKLADLVVLSDDPFEIPEDALQDVRVLTTIVGGETMHDEAT